MKLASIRSFRSGITSYTRKGDMVIITKNGKMVGCFLPIQGAQEIPVELKREFATTLGGRIASELFKKKVQEKEILNDFQEFKKTRRGQ